MAKNYRPLDDPNDHKFMEDFYLQNNRLIMDKVKKYVSNVDDREDIMQIVAESLVKHISTLKELPKDAIALYINYCCKNAAINMGKARTRRNERLTSLNDEDVAWQVEQTFQGESLEEYIISREQIAQLREIWPNLSKEEQLLLEGKYIWGFSDKELAVDFNCKPDSIRMKLTRVRRKVFQLLSEREGVL